MCASRAHSVHFARPALQPRSSAARLAEIGGETPGGEPRGCFSWPFISGLTVLASSGVRYSATVTKTGVLRSNPTTNARSTSPCGASYREPAPARSNPDRDMNKSSGHRVLLPPSRHSGSNCVNGLSAMVLKTRERRANATLGKKKKRDFKDER